MIHKNYIHDFLLHINLLTEEISIYIGLTKTVTSLLFIEKKAAREIANIAYDRYVVALHC